jgi:mannose-6-phosphate isomerase-like protein (cupin superfamily)
MKSNMEILLHQAQGNAFWVLGDLYIFKVTGKQTNGAYTIIEQTIHPQGGPPPHIHHMEDEAFYILEGRFSFLCGDKQSVFEAGSFINIPRGTLHTFKNVDEQPGRLLVVISPSGLEEFFYSIGTPATDVAIPPAFDAGIIQKIMELSKNFQMEVILPEPS